jgi:hypothetical protein
MQVIGGIFLRLQRLKIGFLILLFTLGWHSFAINGGFLNNGRYFHGNMGFCGSNEHGNGQGNGHAEHGNGQGNGHAEHGNGQGNGHCEHGNGQGNGHCEHGNGQGNGHCEHGNGQGNGHCEHGNGQGNGHCEHGNGQGNGHGEHGNGQGNGHCEHGNGQGNGHCEHGNGQGNGHCEHGNGQGNGHCEHGNGQGNGHCEHGNGQGNGHCEHGNGQGNGHCEHGNGQGNGHCEHGNGQGNGHDNDHCVDSGDKDNGQASDCEHSDEDQPSDATLSDNEDPSCSDDPISDDDDPISDDDDPISDDDDPISDDDDPISDDDDPISDDDDPISDDDDPISDDDDPISDDDDPISDDDDPISDGDDDPISDGNGPDDDPPSDDGQLDDEPPSDDNGMLSDDDANDVDDEDDDDNFSWLENVQITPILFGDGLRSRLIIANAPPVLPAKIAKIEKIVKGDFCKFETIKVDQEEKTFDRTINVLQSQSEDMYQVIDYKEGMAFMGAVVSVSFGPVPAAGLSVGGGLLALFEGDSESSRRVKGLENAKKVHKLKRPKDAIDVEEWRIGDRLSYTVGVGAMAPLGAGAILVGVGFTPIVQGRWRVIIEKLSDIEMKVDFRKEKDLGFRTGIGTLFAHSVIYAIGTKEARKSYHVDISNEQGQAQFRDLIRLSHMFKGGMKDVERVRDKETGELYISLRENGRVHGHKIDKKKFRLLIPFLVKFTIGTKKNSLKEKTIIYVDDITKSKRALYCKRKTEYKNFKGPHKTKHAHDIHRIRQRNGVVQGLLMYENGKRSLSCEAKANFITNDLRHRKYKKHMKYLEEFFDLDDSLVKNIRWPENKKYHNSFIASLSMKLTNDAILTLMENKNQLLQKCSEDLFFDVSQKEYAELNKSVKKLSKKLARLEKLLSKEKPKNEEIASILRKVINQIRKDNNLATALASFLQNEPVIKMDLKGTNIQPMSHTMHLY